MKTTIFALVIGLLALNTVLAQSPKEAAPADVATMDGIMKAVYDVISGDAGKPRDWDRMRSLFYKDARLIPSGKNPQTGVVGARSASVDECIKRNEPFFAKEGFFEREIARRTDVYGNIAHVFSTYASYHSLSDKNRSPGASTAFSW